MIEFPCSHQHANSNKETRVQGHVSELSGLLVDSHPGVLAHVLPVLQISVNYVRGKRLQSVIEFVAVHVRTHVLHEVVRPVVEHVTSVGCLVVLNQRQALFKNLGVQEGVERVAGDAEPGDAGTELTRVLLLG